MKIPHTPLEPREADFEFIVSINGGPNQKIFTPTSVYRDAATIAGLMFADPREGPITVKIWCEKLVDTYAPTYYRIEQNEYVGLTVSHVIRPKGDKHGK